jgi:hypothetical protein
VPCRSPELASAGAIYAYSFILTNLDVTAPDKAVAVEHWYRRRTTMENIFRDRKLGAALRHLPSGYPKVNTAWMWGRCSPRTWPPGCTSSPRSPPARTSWQGTVGSDIEVSVARWKWVRLGVGSLDSADLREIVLREPSALYDLVMNRSQFDAPLTLADVREEP